jgi:hypothetical protein
MVVVGSRLEAVRWQLAMAKYIRDHGYALSALVAFTGEVFDKESGPDPFTETSTVLNPNLRNRDMREAFATDEYQILLVANKYQTGFDQPLLFLHANPGQTFARTSSGISVQRDRSSRSGPSQARSKVLYSPCLASKITAVS